MNRSMMTLTAALGALALTACGADDDGAAAPAPTVTVTETVTSSPAPEGTEAAPEPTQTPTATDDACGAADLEDQAFIFVTSPTVGASFSSGDPVQGCANVFEAAYSWEILDSDQTVIADGFGTASCGTGCVGTFSFTPSFTVSTTQVGAIRVFAGSAKDGSDIHVNLIPVLLQP